MSHPMIAVRLLQTQTDTDRKIQIHAQIQTHIDRQTGCLYSQVKGKGKGTV